MVTIREARIEDAAGMAKVHVDSWRTTYAGIVPDTYLANLSYARREIFWRDILGNTSENKYRFVDNPSCRFYEALGGQRLRVEQADFDGLLVDEVAYGWLDIHAILQEKR